VLPAAFDRKRARTWQGYFFQPAYHSAIASRTNTGSIRSVAENTAITKSGAIRSLSGELSWLVVTNPQ
jgi:hypothetical protein